LGLENNQPKQTMTKNESKLSKEEIQLIMEQDTDFLKPMVQFVVQQVLEAEMSEVVGAENGERTGVITAVFCDITKVPNYIGRQHPLHWPVRQTDPGHDPPHPPATRIRKEGQHRGLRPRQSSPLGS
jgi:hypothetical protein